MPNVDKALSSGFLLFFKSQRADFDKDEEQVVSQSVNRGEGSAKVCVRDVSIFGDKDRIRRHFLGRLKTGTLVDIGLDGKQATTTTDYYDYYYPACESRSQARLCCLF